MAPTSHPLWPITEGKQLIVDVPIYPKGKADVYIDDTIGLVVVMEGSDSVMRLERAILLAIYTAARPKLSTEPIPREEMAALNKLCLAEAGCKEIKTILGWVFDFRRLLISLPENKYKAWLDVICNMIETKKVTAKVLETNIGRLVHL